MKGVTEKELKKGIYNMITFKPQTSMYKNNLKSSCILIICINQDIDSHKWIQLEYNFLLIQ